MTGLHLNSLTGFSYNLHYKKQ